MKYIFLFISFFSLAQQSQKVDFKTALANLSINPVQKKVYGTVTYEFEVKESVDTIKIDAQKMSFEQLKINGKEVRFVNSGKSLNLFEGFKKGKNKLIFYYEAFPKQTMYFVGFNPDMNSNPSSGSDSPSTSSGQVWTQGQGKYTSHWFPSFDDVNEKVVFRLNIAFDKNYQVLSNGILMKETPKGNDIVWEYRMDKPMSSYLLALVIGDFRNKVVFSKSRVPMQFFIQPKDTSKFEPTYRESQRIFNFLEKEIGVKYPWEIYRQIPVEDFLYAGMENTSCTLFSQDFVVDSIGFNDRNYINVNAHELAHQWFGDLVTAKSGTHHWLQEGFATYYALLAEREVFGEDYFYHQLYRYSLQLRNAAKTDTIPVMHEKASSLSFYQKGAWALHVLRESIGAKAFQKAVKAYLMKYSYSNTETDDFLTEIKKVSDFNTEKFKKEWLLDYHFPTEEANKLLRKNDFMQTLFEVQSARKYSFEDNWPTYESLIQCDIFYPVKSEIIYQMKEVPFEVKKDMLRLALRTNDLKVRQSVAEFMGKIPAEFKMEYETLLDDASYETREIALIKLFDSFPESRQYYMEKAKNWMGMNDLGLRTTYLFLSQNVKELDAAVRAENLKELIDYTFPKYESAVRQNAFQWALKLAPENPDLLKNLVNATTHHKWQFTKYARETIRELLKKNGYRSQFEAMLPQLNESEQTQLKRLLAEK